ncbi:hypothetical protein ACN42_g7363 [Penicillium freii]|uniref:Uncharacterized protein n=1 Tax=Penicillium freii TaxID=48697 RepID=A0A101MFR9_PENFR|nr:hypothetical protein ACN42_g7363 [Penicillium freii]
MDRVDGNAMGERGRACQAVVVGVYLINLPIVSLFFRPFQLSTYGVLLLRIVPPDTRLNQSINQSKFN